MWLESGCPRRMGIAMSETSPFVNESLVAMEKRLAAIEARIEVMQSQLDRSLPEDRVSIICFSGNWDRLFAAFSIAHGALAMGQEVHLFFTFWGVSALFPEGEAKTSKTLNLLRRLMRTMLSGGARKTPLSRMNFLGMGRRMMQGMLRKEGVDDVDTLLRELRELGAHFHLCETSSRLLGVTPEELPACREMDCCGVATFLNLALKSRIVMFI